MNARIFIVTILILSGIRSIAQINVSKPLVSWISPKTDSSITAGGSVNLEACIKSKVGVKTVKLYLNNVLVETKNIDTVPEVVVKKNSDCSTVYRKKVSLRPGGNNIKLIVTNEFGTTAKFGNIYYSAVDPTTYNINRPQRRKALVIGNAKYLSQNFIPSCYNDADSIEKVLTDLGFIVIKRVDLTMESFLPAIDSFCNDLDKYDVALLYYSGHGFEVNSLNCVFPVDAGINDVQSLLRNYSISSDPNSGIAGRFYRSGAKKCLFFMDACRDNPLYDTISHEFSLQKSLKKVAKSGPVVIVDTNYIRGTQSTITNATECLISYATTSGRTAESISRNNGKNSPYTAALLKNLKRSGLYMMDFLKGVQATLKRTSVQGQDCSFYYGLTDDFCFNPADTSFYIYKTGYLVNIVDKKARNYCGIFRNIVVDMNAKQDTISGLQFHIDFEIAGMRGSNGRLQIEFFDEAGIPLKDHDESQSIIWTSGKIELMSEFASDQSIYSNIDLNNDLFLAYSNFDPKFKGKKIMYKITGIANDYIKLSTRLFAIELPVWNDPIPRS